MTKILIDRAVVEQALEALEVLDRVVLSTLGQNAITALRAKLAEPVQEPVAWWKRHRDGSVELNDARTFIAEDAIATGRRPLIFGDTSPPQRDALVKALRKHVELHDGDCICEDCAAIAAVEGEKT